MSNIRDYLKIIKPQVIPLFKYLKAQDSQRFSKYQSWAKEFGQMFIATHHPNEQTEALLHPKEYFYRWEYEIVRYFFEVYKQYLPNDPKRYPIESAAQLIDYISSISTI